ncbi:MAG: 16S rRNA (uracil(1498)-N(3))-methyltransferase [Endomicrobium sp.]|jgi:16S rRNA (uracil1498-N3)-methyltransferase|nr:16S rRNA (uracil(1498)-N(3))-methyltransferase [Endomicrobium sp.]
MRYFYINPKNIKEKKVFFDCEKTHHIRNVLRLKINDSILLFDGIGNYYEAKISCINKKSIIGIIIAIRRLQSSKLKIKLFIALPKGNRLKWLVEKCAELGVSKIIPIKTNRSTKINFSENFFKKYMNISIAASAQCRRLDIMELEKPMDFISACQNAYYKSFKKKSISILSWECEKKLNINNILSNCILPMEANVFIGPEGGFSSKEIDIAKSFNIYTVTISNNILRVETAAIVSVALVINHFKGL